MSCARNSNGNDRRQSELANNRSFFTGPLWNALPVAGTDLGSVCLGCGEAAVCLMQVVWMRLIVFMEFPTLIARADVLRLLLTNNARKKSLPNLPISIAR
jgi:hypothetical protein